MSTGAARALIATFCLVLATTAVDTAAPAGAQAPACPTRGPQPAAAPSGPPWPQQRYAVQRFGGLADGRGVTVAVIDSGVDPTHPQLRDAVLPGADLLDGSSPLTDCVGHGTAVASIIAARPVEGTAFRGLAPGATVLSLRVSELIELEDGGTAGRRGSATGLASAVRTAVSSGARVINLSLVSYRDDPAVRDAIRHAVDSDVVVVAAAGNRFESGNPVPYPASYDGVVGVGAIGPDGRRLAGSQVGPHVDLVAPGAQVVTAGLPKGHTVGSGTSFAVPFVAAAAALVRQYAPGLSAKQVVDRLIATADAPAGDVGYGAGVLNPYRALTEQIGDQRKHAEPAVAAPGGVDTQAGQRSAARRRALTVAIVGLAVCALVVLVALVSPRAKRRRWRPGVRSVPAAAELSQPDPGASAFGEHVRR